MSTNIKSDSRFVLQSVLFIKGMFSSIFFLPYTGKSSYFFLDHFIWNVYFKKRPQAGSKYVRKYPSLEFIIWQS